MLVTAFICQVGIVAPSTPAHVDWRVAQVVTDLQIGALEGPEEITMGYVERVSVQSDGDIVVLDLYAKIIRQYDSAGRYVRAIGRSGSGPGEYQDVGGLLSTMQDRTVVWDPQSSRITVFDSAGTLVDMVAVPRGVHPRSGFQVDQANTYYVKTLDVSGLRVLGGDPVEERGLPVLYIVIHSDGTVLDTLRVARGTTEPPFFVLRSPQGDRYPFSHARFFLPSSTGDFIAADNRFYLVTILHRNGDTTEIRRPAVPLTIRAGERRQWVAWARYFERLSGGGVQYPAIPRTKPVFRDVVVDREGRIWVELYVRAERYDGPRNNGSARPAVTWHEPASFDVFAPTGAYIGRIVPPSDTRVVVTKGSRMWGVRTGAFGEHYVVRMSIVSSSDHPHPDGVANLPSLGRQNSIRH